MEALDKCGAPRQSRSIPLRHSDKEPTTMIAAPAALDQPTLALLRDHDPVVQRSRTFFALLDWSHLPERDPTHPWPGSPPHPASAYVKALLVNLCEHKEY